MSHIIPMSPASQLVLFGSAVALGYFYYKQLSLQTELDKLKVELATMRCMSLEQQQSSQAEQPVPNMPSIEHFAAMAAAAQQARQQEDEQQQRQHGQKQHPNTLRSPRRGKEEEEEQKHHQPPAGRLDEGIQMPPFDVQSLLQSQLESTMIDDDTMQKLDVAASAASGMRRPLDMSER